MIQDLLPLYHDHVCSDLSRNLVNEHLLECDICRGILDNIDNEIHAQTLRMEKESIIEYHPQTVKRKSLLVGLSISGVLAIPILVCLIVNLATSHALDWFFIVLTSLMILASVTVVPLVTVEKRGLWTLGSFTASLLLLLLTCCLYTGGNWFSIAAISVLFGLSVVFLPYVLLNIPLKGVASQHKGLIAMTIDTVLLYAIVIMSGFRISSSYHWPVAILITTVSLSLPWTLFTIIRYLKLNPLTKAGISVIISGLYVVLLDGVILFLLEGTLYFRFSDANLWIWNHADIINANSHLLTLLSACLIGGILLLLGLFRKGKH